MLTVVNEDGTAPHGSLIDEIVREGARRMLAAVLEAEVNTYIAELADQRDEGGGVRSCATATTSPGGSPPRPGRSRSKPRA